MIEGFFNKTNSVECLNEMAQISPVGGNDQFKLLIVMAPEKNAEGNPYFKVYDNGSFSSAKKVARVHFKKPILVSGHSEPGKKEWLLSEFSKNPYRKNMVDYLNSKSSLNKNVTVWTMLRYQWNEMKFGGKITDIDGYMNGKYDISPFLSDDNYVPYNQQMPDYLDSLEYDPKGKIKRGKK